MHSVNRERGSYVYAIETSTKMTYSCACMAILSKQVFIVLMQENIMLLYKTNYYIKQRVIKCRIRNKSARPGYLVTSNHCGVAEESLQPDLGSGQELMGKGAGLGWAAQQRA